ncbi:MAG: nucleotidyl transferase AbiEii/AbiGii toxin family protein [Candidatus Dormibacteria bacterium]
MSLVPGMDQVVLGGYLALQHYLDYRTTSDIDAWWEEGTALAERERLLSAVGEILVEVGNPRGLTVVVRRFTDVVSAELHDQQGAAFSVQVGERSVVLEPSIESPWPPIRIETLRDNLGAKMNALVRRGAPRDFLDVYRVVSAGLATEVECWATWAAKNPGLGVVDARHAVLRHLAELEMRRPLQQVPADEQSQASAVRVFHRGFASPQLEAPSTGGLDV